MGYLGVCIWQELKKCTFKFEHYTVCIFYLNYKHLLILISNFDIHNGMDYQFSKYFAYYLGLNKLVNSLKIGVRGNIVEEYSSALSTEKA